MSSANVAKKIGNSVKLSPEAAAALEQLHTFHGNKNKLVDDVVLWLAAQETDVQLLVLGKLSKRLKDVAQSHVKWNFPDAE